MLARVIEVQLTHYLPKARMHKLTQKILSFVFLFFLLSSVQAGEKGLLWQVEAPNGKVSYLFGSMHTDDPRVNDYPEVLTNALAQADSFYMEAFPPNDPTIFLMPDRTNAQLLHEDELDKVRELAERHSMRFDIAMRMKPWLLAIVFDLPKPQSDFSQDAMLAAMARDKGKQVLALESADEHFSVLDLFTIDEQVEMLRAVLKHSQEDKERDFETLIKAYMSGDTEKIGMVDEKITRGMLSKALWDKMRVKILDERNVLMADRMAVAANEGSVFVTMGASHLGGKQGVVAKLREKGFKLSVLFKSFN